MPRLIKEPYSSCGYET